MDKKKGFIAEFKQFISRGNVLDLAVGLIIGSAFTAIVTSLVEDLLTPIIGIILKKAGIEKFADWAPGGFGIGSFINAIVSFLLISFTVFLLVKAVNKAQELGRKKTDEPEEEKAPPVTDISLLTEIRDLLLEARSQKQEAREEVQEARSQKSEARDQKQEARDQKQEARDQKPEAREEMQESGEQKADVKI